MTLEFADPKPGDHLGILLYGQEGCGKSTAAASAPGPIIYCNADRPGAIRFARRVYHDKPFLELPIDGKRPLDELYVALRSGEYDDVQTVVLDSLGRIYDLLLAEIAKDDKKPTLPERGEVNTVIERMILHFLELPINLVIVAHDNPVVTTGSEEDGTANIELFPFAGTNAPGLAKKIMRALDIVAYCGSRDIPEDQELPDSVAVDRERRREYVAQLAPMGGRRAKGALGVLGDVERLDLTDWLARIKGAYESPPDVPFGAGYKPPASTPETAAAEQQEASVPA